MTLKELRAASPAALAALSPVELLDLQSSANVAMQQASRNLAVLQSELERRYATGVNKTGVTRRNDGDVEVVVTLPKRVKWDQRALETAVATVRSWGSNPADYVETEIKVSETRYNAWPSEIRVLFEPARTVETGKPKIELALTKQEAA